VLYSAVSIEKQTGAALGDPRSLNELLVVDRGDLDLARDDVGVDLV